MSQTPQKNVNHSRWVRATHLIITMTFVSLSFSGFVILMCHPRLYWGEVGNDLTPALFELPISRNYQHGGWQKNASFFGEEDSPISASRTYEIFNENGWGRSLHFLSAWILVITGLIYLFSGIFSGHIKNHLWPRAKEFTRALFLRDIKDHIRMRIPLGTGGPQYGLLQKLSYTTVVLFLLPLTIITGLTMAPKVTMAYPFLLNVFGGMQSARTIHFFASVLLVLFLLVHVLMIVRSGFKKQIRSMTIGK